MSKKVWFWITGLIIVMILVGILWKFGFLPEVIEGKKACPDYWYENQMPGTITSGKQNQYFVINGQRQELKDYNIQWIKFNCPVHSPQLIY